MRIIEMSGGLEFGPPQGPWIDVIPVPPSPSQPVTIDEAIETAKTFNDPTEWWSWQSFKRQHPVSLPARRKAGAIGINETTHCHIRFLYQRGQQPVQALYAIEEFEAEHGDGLPPALAGAVLAAAQAKKYPTAAPMIIARLCDLQPPGEITHFNRRQIKTLTDVYIGALINGNDASLVTMPGGSTDRARFWLAAGQRLWDPQVRMRVARRTFPLEVILTNNSLAAAVLELQAPDHIQVAGVRLRLPKDIPPISVWPQVLEWERGNISADALRYLVNGKMPLNDLAVDYISPAGQSKPLAPGQADLARGLAASLLREAEENAVYVPSGAFVLGLPKEYPLRAWGIQALRVWAQPDGLWVATVANGQMVVSFGWQPGRPLARWVVTKQAEPLLQVTLAALWRDLRVAGETAVPERGKEPRPRTAQAERDRRQRPHRRGPSKRTLPSLRRVRLSGHRTWGSQRERRLIQVRAHGVRGHLRRLPAGWKASREAKEIAQGFGVLVPDGFTFVRPHVRGHSDGGDQFTVPAEVIVQARGLASVMMLLS